MAELFNKIIGWLYDFGVWILEKALDGLKAFANWIIECIALILKGVNALLPTDTGLPAVSMPQALIDLLGTLNWFLPLDVMCICVGVLAVFVILLFTIRPILKFIQVA